MTCLRDKELFDRIKGQGNNALVIGIRPDKLSYDKKDSPIQASSIDLTVGDIFVPESEPLEKLPKPKKSFNLDAGGTAVVRTKEKLNIPKDIAAIGFPPTPISGGGILTTNPGHIDPGYKGHLHLTMINMGKDKFYLYSGQVVMTVIFFILNDSTQFGFQERLDEDAKNIRIAKGNSTTEQIESTDEKIVEILDKLSPDFMDFRKSAKTVAKEVFGSYVDKFKIPSFVIGILLTIIATFVTSNFSSNIVELEAGYQMEDIKIKQILVDFESKIYKLDLKEKKDSLEIEYKKLEKKMSNASKSKP